jgi:hypothetical protein
MSYNRWPLSLCHVAPEMRNIARYCNWREKKCSKKKRFLSVVENNHELHVNERLQNGGRRKIKLVAVEKEEEEVTTCILVVSQLTASK